jgi:hypothetical protein
MRAARFILFGILLVLIGTYAPNAVAGLLYINSGTLNPLLGSNGFYLYLAQIILTGLGFIMGLIGLFLRDSIPVPSVVDLPPSIPLEATNGSQAKQEDLPSHWHQQER